jgi:hypothetical protein
MTVVIQSLVIHSWKSVTNAAPLLIIYEYTRKDLTATTVIGVNFMYSWLDRYIC